MYMLYTLLKGICHTVYNFVTVTLLSLSFFLRNEPFVDRRLILILSAPLTRLIMFVVVFVTASISLLYNIEMV